jgi:hypothetical protein
MISWPKAFAIVGVALAANLALFLGVQCERSGLEHGLDLSTGRTVNPCADSEKQSK